MKKFIIFSLIVILLMVIIILIIPKNKKNNQKNIYQTYLFYKDEYKDVYPIYQKRTNQSIKNTILQVNMGLNHPFYTHTKEITDNNSLTVLVNKYNYVNKNYIPNNLVKAEKNTKENVLLKKEAYDAFLKMTEDIEKENLHLRIISGYRSFNYQEKLYNNYLKYDSQDKVDKYSARPGFSEHHTGLAIDLDNGITDYNRFHITREFNWLKENAYKYGFILRYPLGKEYITGYKYEPWHYRYVGVDIATYIHDYNITFEEYYYEFLDKE